MNTERIIAFVKERRIPFIIVGAIVLFLAVRFILLQKPNTELTYTVKREDLVDSFQVSGTYSTAAQTQVTSSTNGIITELYVNNNDHVNKGDPLFHVDSTATEDQQKAAYAAYASAQSALQSAQNNKQSLDATMWAKQQAYLAAQNVKNYKTNHTQNPLTKTDYTDLEKLQIDNAVVQTQKDFEAAQQAYKTADVAVNAAAAQADATKRTYQETQNATVTAPATGVVVNLLSQVGDQVTAASANTTNPQPTGAISQPTLLSNTSAQPVLVIANLGNPAITANISEDYATRITVGQKASIVFDALKNQTFSSKIDNIATVGTTNAGVVTYKARISSDQLPASLKPNMTALITVETLRKDDVITVPNSALMTKNGENFVTEAKTHKHIPVTIGTRGLAKTEIVDGLTEGTQIVADPTQTSQ